MTSDLFRPLAGPFYEGDSWMMALIIADLRRGKIPYEVRVMPDGSKEIWRSVEGWREVIEIEAEEVFRERTTRERKRRGPERPRPMQNAHRSI